MSDQDATTVAGQPRHDEIEGHEGQEGLAPTADVRAPEAAVSAADAAVDSATVETTHGTTTADGVDGTAGAAEPPLDPSSAAAEAGGGRSRVGQLEREGE